jgi:hypothetical protein
MNLTNPIANKCIDAENEAGSRVLLAQHPRPSLISGHDWRSAKINKENIPINRVIKNTQ